MMEAKRLLVLPSEVKALEGEEGMLEGIMTTNALDLTGEVVHPEGARNLGQWNEHLPLPLYYEHDRGEHIGHSLLVTPQKTQIKTRSKLAMGHRTVTDRVLPLLASGSLRAFSIGFVGHSGEEDAKGNWHWQDWSLLEHSLVSCPANPEATFRLAKSLGYETGPLMTKGVVNVKHPSATEQEGHAWDAAAAEKRMRAWAGDDWEKYRSCHLWYDAANAESFGSYKLLVCDVVDSKPQVMWRAIVAVMAVLGGGRGGVDIPEADKTKVRDWCLSRYEDFGKEKPEKSAEGIVWRADEKHILEVNLFGEKLRRLQGAVQGAHDIWRHWQGAGAEVSLEADDIDGLRLTQQHIETLLGQAAVKETVQSAPGVKEALAEALHVQLDVKQRLVELLAGR